jgi:hypothetical protein
MQRASVLDRFVKTMATEVTSFDGVAPGGGGGLSTQRQFVEIAPDTSAVPLD